MKKKYKLKFYLNGRHYVYINKHEQEIRANTLEIIVYVENLLEEMMLFGELENNIKDYLLKFEGKIFNEIDELKENNFKFGIEPIAKLIFKNLLSRLKQENILLLKIEVSGKPTRTVIIES